MSYNFHLCFMIYELIINSEHKLAKIIFHGVRPLYVVDNANSKRKGRPPKKKAFNFNPKKLKLDPVVNDDEVPTSSNTISASNALTTKHYLALNIDYSLITNETLNRKPIVKLENYLVNICFFNSTCQALYSLNFFHTYLEQTTINHPVVRTLKELFRSMRNTNEIVKTYDYMVQIHEYFNGYQLTHQYDAEQCLRYILEICYPDIHNAASDNDFDTRFNDQFIFRVTMNETYECEQKKGQPVGPFMLLSRRKDPVGEQCLSVININVIK